MIEIDQIGEAMNKSQRHAAITSAVQREGSVFIVDIVASLAVSTITARRDLAELERTGVLRRVSGGAVLPSTQGGRAAPLTPVPRTSSGRPAVLGLIVPSVEYYFSAAVKTIIEASTAAGARGTLAISYYSADEEVRQFRRFMARGVDAVIITPGSPDVENSAIAAEIQNARCPVVVLERNLTSHALRTVCDSVRSDHAGGVYQAVRFLAATGAQRIALHALGDATAPQLKAGFEQAVRDLAVEPVNSLVGRRRTTQERWAHTPQSPLTKRWLEGVLEGGADSVIVNPDQHAIALLDIALELGLRVPQDLQIISYDDEVAEMAGIPLTAVSPLKQDLGRLAVEMCIERINTQGTNTSPPRTHHALIPALMVRESTRPLITE